MRITRSGFLKPILKHQTTWLVGGWAYPSEKYEFVSWDDEIPNIWKVTKFMFQNTKLTFRTTHPRSLNPKIRVTEPPQKGHFEDPEQGFLFWPYDVLIVT